MEPRRVRVRALAKINLDLRVLGLRPDGYHDLRSVFQTISLADNLDVEFTPARKTEVAVFCTAEIAGPNIVERAALLALDTMKVRGRVRIRLEKQIPMGAGLGGGSSDAAAVLLAVSALAGKSGRLEKLIPAAACLGSDVPFFLLGGTAVALDRGTELYPLPDRRPEWGLVIAPGIHVSTAEAYRDLDTERARARNAAGNLTSGARQNIISSFQSVVWEQGGESCNDFETVVFAKHPRLRYLKQKLTRQGARKAMLSGSGSALFGIFGSREDAARARLAFDEEVFLIRLVTRPAFRARWRRGLGAHAAERVWPPHSRHERWTRNG